MATDWKGEIERMKWMGKTKSMRSITNGRLYGEQSVGNTVVLGGICHHHHYRLM